MKAGYIAWASTWPQFEKVKGQPDRYPIIAIQHFPLNGNVRVAALTHSLDACSRRVRVTRAMAPSAFPPLNTGLSVICLFSYGVSGVVTASVKTRGSSAGALTLPGRVITYTDGVQLPDDEWQRIRVAILKAST